MTKIMLNHFIVTGKLPYLRIKEP